MRYCGVFFCTLSVHMGKRKGIGYSGSTKSEICVLACFTRILRCVTTETQQRHAPRESGMGMMDLGLQDAGEGRRFLGPRVYASFFLVYPFVKELGNNRRGRLTVSWHEWMGLIFGINSNGAGESFSLYGTDSQSPSIQCHRSQTRRTYHDFFQWSVLCCSGLTLEGQKIQCFISCASASASAPASASASWQLRNVSSATLQKYRTLAQATSLGQSLVCRWLAQGIHTAAGKRWWLSPLQY